MLCVLWIEIDSEASDLADKDFVTHWKYYVIPEVNFKYKNCVHLVVLTQLGIHR